MGAFVCGVGMPAPADALRTLTELRHCCADAVEFGPTCCTCWEEIYDIDQAPIDRVAMVATRLSMCDDCAYRPGSPERSGDPRYMARNEAGDGGLPDVPAGATFWCHQGIRKPIAYRHSTLGIEIPAKTDHYSPAIFERDGQAIPFKADGSPAERCAGWFAHNRDDVEAASA